jgi:hypothetical protein
MIKVPLAPAPTATSSAAVAPIGAMTHDFNPLRRLLGIDGPRVDCKQLTPAAAKTLSDMTVYFSSAEWNYVVEDPASKVNGMVDNYLSAKMFVLSFVESARVRELVVEMFDELDVDGYMKDGEAAYDELLQHHSTGAPDSAVDIIIELFKVWTIAEGQYNINETKRLVVLKTGNINISPDAALSEGLVQDTEAFCDFCIALRDAIRGHGHKKASRDRVLLFFLALASRDEESVARWLLNPRFDYLTPDNRAAVASFMHTWQSTVTVGKNKRESHLKEWRLAGSIIALFSVMCFDRKFNQYVPSTAQFADEAPPAEAPAAATPGSTIMQGTEPTPAELSALPEASVVQADASALAKATEQVGAGICAYHSRGDRPLSPCTTDCLTARLGSRVERSAEETARLRTNSPVFAMAATQVGTKNAARGALIGSLIGAAHPEHAKALIGAERVPTRVASTATEWVGVMSVLDHAKVNSAAKLDAIDDLARAARWANVSPNERAKRYVAAYSGCSFSDIAAHSGWGDVSRAQRAAIDGFKKQAPAPGLRSMQILAHMAGSDSQ